MAIAYISLGTNLGDRPRNLATAIRHIKQKAGMVTQLSSVYETEPWGFESDEHFLNQVIKVETPQDPHTLMSTLLEIEKIMGRERNKEPKYTSRIIDLDMLFYENRIISSEYLKLPHPHISDRKFILIPLNEISASLVHPVYNKTISKLLTECEDNEAVKKMTTKK